MGTAGKGLMDLIPKFSKGKNPTSQGLCELGGCVPEGWMGYPKKKGEWLVRGVLVLLSRGSLENVGFLINHLFLISFKNII